MERFMQVVDELERDIRSAKAGQEKIVADYIKDCDLHSLVVEFASKLSAQCGVSDDDQGVFDSNFCGRLEEHIEKEIRKELNIKTAKALL